MRKICLTALLTPILIFVFIFAVQAQSPQETLTRYLSDIQKSPADYALREKIIRHVQTMKPAPAIPEEAERHMARGGAAVKGAKSEKDFQDAVSEFEKASLAAPWLAAAYYNLGIARDKAGMYADAIKSLKLYLLANPNASDTKAVKNLIYEIEYRQEKAAKESSLAAIAAKKQNEYEEWLRKIDGARYKYHVSTNRDAGYWILDIQRNQVVKGLIITWSKFSPEDAGIYQRDASTTLNGQEFILTSSKWFCSDFKTKAVEKGRISDDGNSITSNVCNETRIYRRER